MSEEKYTCIDCGFVGELNTEITYKPNGYACLPCYEKWYKKTNGVIESSFVLVVADEDDEIELYMAYYYSIIPDNTIIKIDDSDFEIIRTTFDPNKNKAEYIVAAIKD